MTSLQTDLDRIESLLKEAIDADLATRRSGAGRPGLHFLFRKRRARVKWAALAGATGIAAAVTTFVLVGGSEPYAFAGWSASPTAPATGQLTSAVTDCATRIAQLPPRTRASVQRTSSLC